MELSFLEAIEKEICHYASKNTFISSKHNRIYISKSNLELQVSLPRQGWKDYFGFSRYLRRLLRLDKCNVALLDDGFIAIRMSKVYRYYFATKELKHVLTINNCRNVLHQSIAVVNGNEIFFGEYGNNSDQKVAVTVYRSLNGGESWDKIYQFPPGKIKHIHGCYYDPYEEKIWTLTGDFKGQCYMLCSDKDFADVEWIGDGDQVFRACNLFFEKDSIHWVMDSQLQDSYHIEMDRKTREIHKRTVFAGPVWYIKKLVDGYYLAATAQEKGAGVKDEYAHLYASKDLIEWQEIYRFEHDGLPKRYFKNGIVSFADGDQDSTSFYIFTEAIKNLDGKIAKCKIIDG